MKKLLLLAILGSACFTNAQQLQFSEIGTENAFCRLFNYQSGNGVVYAAVTGGTPDYTFQLTNLLTGEITSNSTWGGLNPGQYEVKVWDDVNDSIVQIVTLDSINPVANFDIIGQNVSEITAGYVGYAPVTVVMYNTSTGFANFGNPNSDTTFFWQFEAGNVWGITHDYNYTPNYYYSTGGTYEISLVALNKNGCTDTTTKLIGLFDLADADELSSGSFSIQSNVPNSIVFQKTNHFEPINFKLIDLGGKVLLEEMLSSSNENISHNVKAGIYIYQLVDSKTLKTTSGKIQLK
ncbi:MAG: hypothetical protein ACI857_002963 [Arenicella sp.]|jgi:hypothetical protein